MFHFIFYKIIIYIIFNPYIYKEMLKEKMFEFTTQHNQMNVIFNEYILPANWKPLLSYPQILEMCLGTIQLETTACPELRPSHLLVETFLLEL